MRLKDVVHAAIVVTIVGVPALAQGPVDRVTEATRFDVSAGYQYIDANAPPGGCPCFGLNGGYASAGIHLNRWLSGEFKFSGSHSNNISSLGQGLTLMTYMGGPKVSYRAGRFVPFGLALFGGARGTDSYFPTGATYTTTASSFAFSAGGGIDYNLSRRFAIRAVEAEYLRTSFPNNATSTQNHLMIGAGIVLKFQGHRHADNTPPPVTEAPNKVSGLECSTKSQDVKPGQVVDVTAKASTLYPMGDVVYSWTTSGGTVQGTGRRITVNTGGVAGGDYVITGHATLAGGTGESAECEVNFHVKEEPKPMVIEVPQPPPPVAPTEAEFHENVPDALFDYDKWNIRPDAQVAINHAAEYLIKHPKMRVLIGGFSDERGTAEYNVALGLKRANATRDALMAAGVPADRMQVISYGKGAQVCTAENEACWQQNRRAAFSLHP